MEIHCSNCDSKSEFLFKVSDFNKGCVDKKFEYWRCPACHLIFLPEIPDGLADYYDNSYYEFYSPKNFLKIANKNLYQIKMIQKFVASGRLLEIGPGKGVFAHVAKQAGFEVDVIEMSELSCNYLSDVVGVNVIKSDRPQNAIKAMGKHDVIVAWHNIEHLPDPWTFLNNAADNLAPGGILLIAAPNPSSLQFKILGSGWTHLDPPRHLYLIPVEILIQRLKPLGLECVMLEHNDRGGRYLNREGWQCFLMNKFSSRFPFDSCIPEWERKLWALLGLLISLPLAPLERTGSRGAAYTLIFQKSKSSAEIAR